MIRAVRRSGLTLSANLSAYRPYQTESENPPGLAGRVAGNKTGE